MTTTPPSTCLTGTASRSSWGRETIRSRTENPPPSFYPPNCPSWPLSPSPRANCDQQHVILATSSAPNTAYRQRLRDQLGNKYFLLFLLGSGPDQGLLEDEARQFGDILQAELEEEYRALPYKILLGYVWVNRYCGSDSKERCQTRNLPWEIEINFGVSFHQLICLTFSLSTSPRLTMILWWTSLYLILCWLKLTSPTRSPVPPLWETRGPGDIRRLKLWENGPTSLKEFCRDIFQ